MSMAARGLLWELCSHAPGYEVTLEGLAATCTDGKDAIRTAKNELEAAGYLRVHRVRDKAGRLTRSEWTITDDPDQHPFGSPKSENPTLDDPKSDFPTLEKPTQENPPQRSTEGRSTEERNTEGASPPPPLEGELLLEDARKGKTLIPMTMDWVIPKAVDEFGAKIGLTPDQIDDELPKFQRHFMATDVRRTDRGWVQAFRKWLAKSIEIRERQEAQAAIRRKSTGPQGQTPRDRVRWEQEQQRSAQLGLSQ